jgi:uncharacterized protein (DUF1499 family)
MKSKKYHNIGAVPKFIKISEKEAKLIHLEYNSRLLTFLDGLNWFYGLVGLVYGV